jgi:hypothetical protein
MNKTVPPEAIGHILEYVLLECELHESSDIHEHAMTILRRLKRFPQCKTFAQSLLEEHQATQELRKYFEQKAAA